MGRHWNNTFTVECDHCHVEGERSYYTESDAAEDYLQVENARMKGDGCQWFCWPCAYKLKLAKPPRDYDRPPKKGTRERQIYDMTMATLKEYAKGQAESIERFLKIMQDQPEDFVFKKG